MDKNYDQEFAKLTSQLDDLADLGKPFEPTLAHLSEFCDILNGLACHVNRYITKTLSPTHEDPEPIVGDLAIAFVASYELLCGVMDHMCMLVCGQPEEDEDEEEGESDVSDN